MGTYIRFGSTNRLADAETIYSLQLLARNVSFDELPYVQSTIDILDWPIANDLFKKVNKSLDMHKSKSYYSIKEDYSYIWRNPFVWY